MSKACTNGANMLIIFWLWVEATLKQRRELIVNVFKITIPLQAAHQTFMLIMLGITNAALAVELGPVSVDSSLQAPLAASLPLHGSDAYPLDELEVAIGKASSFAATGLEWVPAIDDVQVELTEWQGSRQVIVRSSQPITASWLDLLLTIDYPQGRLTHPVTLLFDPPDEALEFASPHVASTSPEMIPASVLVSNAVSGMKDRQVREGDTLWRIAERSKPDHISVPQMMLALIKANPAIFPADDINSLRAGQMLKLPDVSQLDVHTRTDAAQAVQAMITHDHHDAQPVSEQENEAGDQVDIRVAPVAAPQSAQNAEQGSAIAELVVQLNQSLANLQQAQAEREQLRRELEELRASIDVFRQRMDDPQGAVPDAIVSASAGLPIDTAHADPHGEHSSELFTGLERYQWPLISLALILLLAGLIWLRKPRDVEEQSLEPYWEGTSFADPAHVKPGAMPSNAQASRVQFQNIPLSCQDEGSQYAFSVQGGACPRRC